MIYFVESKPRRFGIGYKGSKNSIAEFVVSQFPKRKHFYDLFAGGCAVTHCAMLSGKFKQFHINDISDAPRLFYDAIKGKYKDDKRWISRADFFAQKDGDPYIRYCWSFGNAGEDYLYSKEVEPYKKALHYARVLNDFSLLREFGVDAQDASRLFIRTHEKEIKEKYIKWYCKNVLFSDRNIDELRRQLSILVRKESESLRLYLCNALKASGKKASDVDRFLGTNGMAGHYFGKSQWEFPTQEIYEKLRGFLPLQKEYGEIAELYNLLQSLERLERLQSLQSLERLERLQSLQSLERLQSLELTQTSYDNVKIEHDSVIYCDIPYRDTSGYLCGAFDHEKFYDWAERQTEPCFISEYDMPSDRFECVASRSKRILLSGASASEKQEKIFVPKTQIKTIRKFIEAKWTQLEFDFEETA